LEVEPIASDGERFVSAEDMTAFVEWLTGSSCEDYISEEFFNTAGDPPDPNRRLKIYGY
jgi:hypothetical protein